MATATARPRVRTYRLQVYLHLDGEPSVVQLRNLARKVTRLCAEQVDVGKYLATPGAVYFSRHRNPDRPTDD